MQDVHSLLVPAELSLFLSFLLRGGGFRRCFTQGTFRSKPTAMPWVSCSYACACFSRRENARRSFAPRSCGTIAHSLIFAPRRRLPPPRCFTQGTFRSKPVATPWVSCSYACACFSHRENARRSFAPRSCGTIAHSLIFAPRRRLPPPFISRKALFAQNPRQRRGFLALMPAPAFRVAKMQDVLSLLVPAELSLFLSFLLRGGGFRRRCFTQGNFRSKPTAFAVGFLLLCLRLLFASRKCKTFFRSLRKV